MLVTIKVISLVAIAIVSTFVGILISKKYSNRVSEIQDVITGLELLEGRLNYTYDTIPDAFKFIAKHMKTNVKRIFEISSQKLFCEKNFTASEVFEATVDEEKNFLSLNSDDTEVIKGLSISLGQVDLENQTKNIRLIIKSLADRLEEAKVEKGKNFKMCRNLGLLTGMILVIILI